MFDGTRTKAKRYTVIGQAVHRYGYSQREVADWLGLHYATVSQIANRPWCKRQDLTLCFVFDPLLCVRSAQCSAPWPTAAVWSTVSPLNTWWLSASRWTPS